MSDGFDLTEDEAVLLTFATGLGFGRFLRAFHNLVRRGLIFSHADGIVVNSWDERDPSPLSLTVHPTKDSKIVTTNG